MGSQILVVLRQGIWASLTGGWFHDPNQNTLCNILHLYIWVSFLCIPYVIVLYFRDIYAAWILYIILIFLYFVLIKIISFRLHKVFDSSQLLLPSSSNDFHNLNDEWKCQDNEEDTENVEMKVMHKSVSNKESAFSITTEVLTSKAILHSENMEGNLSLRTSSDQHNFNNIINETDELKISDSLPDKYVLCTNSESNSSSTISSFNLDILFNDVNTESNNPEFCEFQSEKYANIYRGARPKTLFTDPKSNHSVSEFSQLKRNKLKEYNKSLHDQKNNYRIDSLQEFQSFPKDVALRSSLDTTDVFLRPRCNAVDIDFYVPHSLAYQKNFLPSFSQQLNESSSLKMHISNLHNDTYCVATRSFDNEQQNSDPMTICKYSPENSFSSSSSGSGFTVYLNNPSVFPSFWRFGMSCASLKLSQSHSLNPFHSISFTSAPRVREHRNLFIEHTQQISERIQSISETNERLEAGFERSTEIASKAILTEKISNIQKHPYKLEFFCFSFNLKFDRLMLLAFLDRNVTFSQNFMCVILAVLVAVFGSLILVQQVYHDLEIFFFCYVISNCQYCLLKSVQPDAASPTHGFNTMVIYSRSIYFILCCSIVLLLQRWLIVPHSISSLSFYGIPLLSFKTLSIFQNILLYFLLFFPILFTLGLIPQINTFFIYLVEQIDEIFFGGNAVLSLSSAFYSITRSLIAIVVLYGFAFGSLHEVNMIQNVLFSIFISLLIAISYFLSRNSTDALILLKIIKQQILDKNLIETSNDEKNSFEELSDPLPKKLEKTVMLRLKTDVFVCIFLCILIFSIRSSCIFVSLQPALMYILNAVAICLGFAIHYIIPHLRKQIPWLCFSHPWFKPYEYHAFEVSEPAHVIQIEKIYIWLRFIEKNLVYPLIIASALTTDSSSISHKFGIYWGSLILVICSLKISRVAYSNTSNLYFILLITILMFNFDFKHTSETFIVDFFVVHIIIKKLEEFLLKLKFVLIYIVPWQITWGSAFHAFAQPFGVPHSGMLFIQILLTSLFSAPLSPFLGSAIFLSSYVRPLKFWEKDYNTKRIDYSNIRLSSQIDQNPGTDDNNLNSIFYEHLTRSLQHSLCGDLLLGRWGEIDPGDIFVLASDNLNCLVHIIEIGNGLVTFQMRGLEFKGTYCQQREVEAITESIEEDEGLCCFDAGHFLHMLSINAAFNQRWLAWEVIAIKYVLEGYSVSDNTANSMMQVYDLRKILISYYVKAIIYYAVTSPKLETWLNDATILTALRLTLDKHFADADPIFNVNIDMDYDFRVPGISRQRFCNIYLDWIQFCSQKREQATDCSKESSLVSFCLCLSLLGRRALGSTNTMASADLFLHGFHSLFKGVFDTASLRDEWVYADMDIIHQIIIPAVRMSVKLHQDHFTFHDEYDDHQMLYNAITSHEQFMVITHESDPVWRHAVLIGVPSLLALRHLQDDGCPEYKVIMLNKRYLTFRVIRINRECVRGLWAGQQQELVFLRNRNPERGSIQNAKQALRNIINSSCDQPIGYPIYVSPLTTSFAETHAQLTAIIGGHINLKFIRHILITAWIRIRNNFCQGCFIRGSAALQSDNTNAANISNDTVPNRESQTYNSLQKVQIIDPSQAYDVANMLWNNTNRKTSHRDWLEKGMVGHVIQRWTSLHHQNHEERNILLVQIGERIVKIAESGVVELDSEV